MKLDELITELQRLLAEHGNLNVARYNSEYGDYIPLKIAKLRLYPKDEYSDGFSYVPYKPCKEEEKLPFIGLN